MDLTKLRVGDIVFFRTRRSLISFLIRTLTKGYVNHVGILTNVEPYEIIHAVAHIKPSKSKVIKECLLKYKRNKNVTLTIGRVFESCFPNGKYDEVVKEVVEKAHKHLGLKYDWSGIIGFIPIIIGRALWLNRIFPSKNFLQRRKRLFCSELIATLWFKTSNLMGNLFAGKRFSDLASTSPWDIAKSRNVRFITGQWYPGMNKE